MVEWPFPRESWSVITVLKLELALGSEGSKGAVTSASDATFTERLTFSLALGGESAVVCWMPMA